MLLEALPNLMGNRFSLGFDSLNPTYPARNCHRFYFTITLNEKVIFYHLIGIKL